MTSKQISSDWKSTLRRSIYSHNRSQMQSHFQNNRQIVENLSNQKNQALVHLNYPAWMQEDFLPAHESHSEIQNFIQLHHQIYTKSHLDYFLPLSGAPGSLERKKVIDEVLKLLKYGKNKKEVQILWKYIVKKYTCPLDLLLKCEIYFQFLKFGTKLMHLLMFIYCDDIKPSVFLESILSVKKYIKVPQLFQRKVEKNQSQLQNRHFCTECSSYCCIRHHSLPDIQPQNQNQYRRDNKGNQVMTYFRLLADFRDIVEFDFIEKQQKTCSIECYRKMKKEQFLKSYETFQPPDQTIIRYVKMAREMYGFLPCQIAQIAKIKCSDTAIYLLLSQKTESIGKNFGLSEHQYLKNVPKDSSFKGEIRCFCRKCEPQKCPCFVSKRQCSPKCTLCFDMQRKDCCLNRGVTIGRRTWLRIGESIEKKCSLGLFSVEPLRKGELALWVSGQIMQKEEEDFRSYFADESSKSSAKSSRLYGKDKFVCTTSPLKANLQIIQKKVQGQLYLLYFTTKDIERQEELLRIQ